jgi:hypothetical protein
LNSKHAIYHYLLYYLVPNTPDFFVNNLPAKLYSLANFYNLIMNVIYLAVVLRLHRLSPLFFFQKPIGFPLVFRQIFTYAEFNQF